MDGANLNAQIGYTSPAYIGADVGHLNLHKTFSIPHGGGGPGVGAIGAKEHLRKFLPGHSVKPVDYREVNAVAAAPYGSAGILPITFGFIKLMGRAGFLEQTRHAILNANYIAESLKDSYKVLYRGQSHGENIDGRVAHELILDLGHFKKTAKISEEDVAKRLMDYGFHAPTISWPVIGGLMIEPTESEDKKEIDQFIDALKQIREEIRDIEEGRAHSEDNLLKNAPHTQRHLMSNDWNHSYSREEAAYPAPWIYTRGKVWPSVGRVDNVYGDRNLVCTCPSVSEYIDEEDS